jgi:DNA-binding response OmpR family regulator
LVSVRDQLADVQMQGRDFEVVIKPVHPEVLLSKVEAFSRRSAAAAQD